ncbi:MAG: formylglycine-generating enzyme family protein [Candidatus Competibacteraceae bacterium]
MGNGSGQSLQRGESTAEGPKQQWRKDRRQFRQHFHEIRHLYQRGWIASKEADDWERIARMTDQEFEKQLDVWYPRGRQTQPAYWHDDAFNNPAQPVVGICWHEARAYCSWLSAQTGESFRLPTEAEWKAAAQGQEGRPYAYGNDFNAALSNTYETHIRCTTPIGVFPGGETPEGLVDMSGNVWNWTGKLYQRYDSAAEWDNPSTEGCRAASGGSWHRNQTAARAAYRFLNDPPFRNYGMGFRVVSSAPMRR